MAERKIKKARKIRALNSDGNLTAPWRKFKLRVELYESDPIQDWTEYNYLGHILKRYKDFMGMEYTLSYSGSPSKCQEIYCVKRMLLSLGETEPQIIKDYIDFVYDKYIVPNKITLSSIAYFFTTNFIFEFKKKFRKNSKITRTTGLPQKYKDIIEKLNIGNDGINTYGDLAFVRLALQEDPNNIEYKEKYSPLLDELKTIGFDDSVLERLDGN